MKSNADKALDSFFSTIWNKDNETTYQELHDHYKVLSKNPNEKIFKRCLDFVKNQEYLPDNDYRLYFIIKLFYQWERSEIVPYLKQLLHTPAVKNFKKEILEFITKFENNNARDFLASFLNDDQLKTEAALFLAKLGDVRGEAILLEKFNAALKNHQFDSEITKALIQINNSLVYKRLKEYINTIYDEKQRLIMAKFLMNLNNKQSAELLLPIYHYYKENPDIRDPQELQADLHKVGFVLQKKYQSSKSFSKLISEDIENFLINFRHHEKIYKALETYR